MRPIIHDEHVTFECACGGVTVARFVIPTRKFQFALIGTCHKCFEQGRDRTTIAYMAISEKDDFTTLLRYSPIIMEGK